MKRLSAILILAALSGCNSIRDFGEWTDRQDRIHTMLINANNALVRRVETLEKDVNYLNRHATTHNSVENPLQNARRVSYEQLAPFAPRACRPVFVRPVKGI